MIIERIEIYRVAMPLVYPFRTSFGDDDCIESVLVKIESDGLYGWGEGAPLQDPGYSPEWAAGQFLLIRERLASRLLGEDIVSGDDLQSRLSIFRGNPFAKGALDLAWWDLYSRSRGEPLWKTLDGRGPTVDVGADFGAMETVDLLIETIGKAIEEGFKRVKLKYRPGWEIDMISAVRRAFPDTVFHVDCNSAYTLDDLPMLKQLDEYDLKFIEQPLMNDDLVDHAHLQREIKTPICLDESITSPAKARKAIEIGACRWVNIKHGRVGGITNAVRINEICEKNGIPCWIGGMLESAVAQAHSVALATLSNIKYPSDIFPTSRFYHEDLSKPEIHLSGPSQITAEPGPGIGVEPDAALLKKMTLEKAELRA